VVSKVLLEILDRIFSRPKSFFKHRKRLQNEKETLTTQKSRRNVKTVRITATINIADTYLLTSFVLLVLEFGFHFGSLCLVTQKLCL